VSYTRTLDESRAQSFEAGCPEVFAFLKQERVLK
jgi:hypothetical protein